MRLHLLPFCTRDPLVWLPELCEGREYLKLNVTILANICDSVSPERNYHSEILIQLRTYSLGLMFMGTPAMRNGFVNDGIRGEYNQYS